MVPGMGHCGGGEGPSTFDMVTPLEQWVEKGQAPARVVASHSTNGKVDRTRPLCAYPQVARYTGSGSTDEAPEFHLSLAVGFPPGLKARPRSCGSALRQPMFELFAGSTSNSSR